MKLTNSIFESPDGAGSLTRPTTSFAYDAVGNLLSLTDPVGNTTAWQYDGLDRVTVETNELSKTRTFKYDAVGNLTERTDRLGRKTELVYDNLYRMTAEKWYDGANLVRTLEFEYDIASRLTEATDPAATLGYTYDNLGRVIAESQSFAGFSPLIEYSREFNAVGNVTLLTAAIGGTADFKNTFSYDNVHRITRLEQSGQSGGNAVAEKRIDFNYNAASQFERIDRYADLAATEYVASTHFAYDGMGRLSSLIHATSTTAPSSGWGSDALAGYQFTYDSASRITAIDVLVYRPIGLAPFSDVV